MSVDAAHSVGPPAGFGKFGAIDRVMVGLIVFLASEVMLFGAFFTAFFYIRYQGTYPVFPPSRTTSRRRSPASTRPSWCRPRSRCTGPSSR